MLRKKEQGYRMYHKVELQMKKWADVEILEDVKVLDKAESEEEKK